MVSAERGGVKALEVTAEVDDHSLRLNNYKVCKENSERKLLVQDIALNAIPALVRRLKKLSSLQSEKRS